VEASFFVVLFLCIGAGDEPVPVPTPPPTEVVPSGVVAVFALPPFDPPLVPPPPPAPPAPPAANAPDEINTAANVDKATVFEIRFIAILLSPGYLMRDRH
jgi:hypothetical protein